VPLICAVLARRNKFKSSTLHFSVKYRAPVVSAEGPKAALRGTGIGQVLPQATVVQAAMLVTANTAQ